MTLKNPFANAFLLLTILVFFGCKKDVKKTESGGKIQTEEIATAKIDSSKKIVIIGKSDDAYALESFQLLGGFPSLKSSIYNKPEKSIINGDSLVFTRFDVKQPQLMDLFAFTGKKDTIPYYSRILISPGDSIKMDIKKGKIKFSGNNAAHYNFFLEMNDPLRQNWGIYINDPYKYKSDLGKSYKEKLSILNKYIREHPDVSDDFKNLVGSELKFEYLFNLMLPRNVPDKLIAGAYVNNNNSIIYEYAIQDRSGENFLDIAKYFDGIDIETFKRPDLINNDYFRRSLILYIRNLFANHDYLEYSRKNFIKEKAFIEQHLDGDLKIYATGRLINDYYMKGFGHGQEDAELMINTIKDFKSNIKDPSSLSRLNEILDELKIFNFQLPETVLNEKLLTLNEDTITVKEIFNKQPNKTKVIDFWASWCAPCITEFKKSKTFRSRIASEEQLSFIYISVDRDQPDWKKKANEVSKDVPKENQYLILNKEKSKLLKHLLIKESSNTTYFTIPKYSIINTDFKVISNNAPRPSDSLLFEKIIKEHRER